MSIEQIYATPIYSTIVNNKSIRRQIEQTLKTTEWGMISNWGHTHLLSSNPFQGNVISKLAAFQKELDYHIKKYTEFYEFYYKSYIIVNSWYSRFEKGHYGHVHDHGDSDISGVYYYQTNGNDGDLFFRSPNPFFKSSPTFNALKGTRRITPEEGRLVLFPGWLEHGINTNMTEDTRISLSFNIRFSRDVKEWNLVKN